MSNREALSIVDTLKLALEALTATMATHGFKDAIDDVHDKAITAIKEALAQPEQETQAYREAAQLAKWLFKTHYAQEEHYASGRVVWGLCDTTAGVISQIDNMVCKLVLPKEPEQEPVAWMDIDEKGAVSGLRYWSEPDNRHEVALYTTPPPVGFAVMQKQWVGLTNEEINEIWESQTKTGEQITRAIEAKLKEKNT
jgi:hypothetical protein